MNSYQLKLIQKKTLTHDVYELVYTCSEPFVIIPWQFLLCDCDANNPKFKRSYSVSWIEWNDIFFIIKRLHEGSWGSKAICDQEIGHQMDVWGPMGRFILRENNLPKVFIGTGTGFAPLYFMMKTHFSQSTKQKAQSKKQEILFLFGVRELRDVFYLDELENWRHSSPFDYQIYCSREWTPFLKGEKNSEENKGDLWAKELPSKHHHGRVTDYLTKNKEQITNNKDWLFNHPDTEYYICGSPAMVTEVRWLLAQNNISEDKVFFEQY